MSRPIKFKFPTDWAGSEAVEVENEPDTVETYCRGMFLCVSSQSSQYRRVYVARVEAIFAAQGQAEVALYWVPPGSGPRQARIWTPWLDDLGIPRKRWSLKMRSSVRLN